MRTPLSKEKRRDAIFQAAIELFESQGYENVTIAEVISKSNVARGTFYLHFDSLETLLIAWFDDVIEQTWCRMRPYLEDLSIPFESCTHHVIHEVFQLYSDNPSMSRVFYCGGGETFMRRRHEAMFGKLGGKLLDALLIRHPEQGHNMSWSVAILISLISDMAHFSGQYVDETLRDAFESRVTAFAMAGLRAELNAGV